MLYLWKESKNHTFRKEVLTSPTNNIAIERAGIERLRFHDLRHTLATRLIQNGIDVYAVQKLGRWRSISMVERYAHHYAESLRSSVELLDAVYDEFSTKKHNYSTINKKRA